MERLIGSGCVVWFVGVVLFNIVIGAWTFSYCLWVIWGKQAPLIADIICGLFLGELSTTAAIVLWILSVFGVHFAH